MDDWDDADVIRFVVEKSKERYADELEGPARLGPYTVWRVWTNDGAEFHAHYAIAEHGKAELKFKRDFPPFALWLQNAFDAKDVHQRRLDWFRSITAALILLALLGLTIWAVAAGRTNDIDYRYVAGLLAVTAVAYLLGEWARKR